MSGLPYPGIPRPLASNPFYNGMPMAGAGEGSLHAALQSIYADHVHFYEADRTMFPRVVAFSTAAETLVKSYLVDISPGVTRIGVNIGCFVPRLAQKVTIRLKTYSISNPPVVVTTGSTFTFDGRSTQDVGAMNEGERVRGIPSGAANLFLYALVEPDTTTHAQQLVDVLLANADPTGEYPIYVVWFQFFEARVAVMP